MIQKISIKNYFSIKDEVILDFEATDDDFDMENQTVEVAPGIRLLRFAVIYGANASGKSNIISVFNYLNRFFNGQEPNFHYYIAPFKFDHETSKEPTEIQITFWNIGKQFVYTLTADSQIVHTENLYMEGTLIFERNLIDGVSQISFGDILNLSDNAKEFIELNCLNNMSLFAALGRINKNIEILSSVNQYLKSSVQHTYKPTQLSNKNFDLLIENKEYILNFLKSNDFNINDFSKIEFEDSKQMKFSHIAETVNGKESFGLDRYMESIGTLTVLEILCVLLQSAPQGAILALDEFDSSIHPEIVEQIVNEYLHNPLYKNIQLIVTTHYDGLLNTVNDLIREDEVFFAEKRANGSTELYSLADFKNLESIKSVQKAYRLGVFGAIPNVNQ